MAKERSFRYQKPSKEALRERANQRGGNFDSYINQKYKMYKVRDGKNLIRILPPTWEPNPDNYYGFNIFVNYQIGADNQSYLSLAKMKNAKDPIAEARLVAEREGDEELARQLRPTERVLMWIIDRNAEDEGPLLWAAPFTVAKAFLNLAFDEDSGKVLYIDDPDTGHDIRFYKEGSQLTTKYDASKMKVIQEPSPISDDEDKQQQWLDYIVENPVPDCLQYYDYKHISHVFNGGGSKAEDDEAPAKTVVKPKLTEEDTKPWDEPSPKRTRPRVAAADEDDEAVSRRRVPPADEDDEVPSGESIRDRIRRRRAEAAAHDDE